MVLGIGHDLVHVPRMARVIARWDDAFLDKVFSRSEQAYCSRFADSAPHFAARFAAKEALYKALSRGRALGLGFGDVEVRRVGPAPVLALSSRAQELLEQAHVVATHLSLSHEHEYASAFVILEGAGE